MEMPSGKKTKLEEEVKPVLRMWKPKRKMGIYAWINLEKKTAYIGESCDMNRRICEHVRSMYSKECSSNNNLVKDFNDGIPFFGVVLQYSRNYLKNDSENEKNWIYDETIYMYEFVKRGYKLYNGEEECYSSSKKENGNKETIKDNEGKLRCFLRGDRENLDKGLLKYCKEKNFSINILEEKKINVREAVDKAIDRIVKNEYEYIIENEEQMYKVCNIISKSYIQREDIDVLGIKRFSIDKLCSDIKKNKFEKIAVCKFGAYFGQSALTILTTKQYDIEHNTFAVKDNKVKFCKKNHAQNSTEKGICFWAYGGRANTDNYRNYLSNNESDKKPRYLFLPYTASELYSNLVLEIGKVYFNIKDGETIDKFFSRMRCNMDSLENDIFVKEYAWNKKERDSKNGCRFEYPETMFPEIVQKRTDKVKKSNVAFLISELGYIDSSISAQTLEKYFTSSTDKNLATTMNYQNNVACATLTDRDGLFDYLSSCKEMENMSEDIKIFVAKIEYPYVVALI